MRTIVALLIVVLPPHAARAQSVETVTAPLAISVAAATDGFRSARSSLSLTLNRPVTVADGALMFVAGDVDVTALTIVSGGAITVNPGPNGFPQGESELRVFRSVGSQWLPLATIPLRVLYSGGFIKAVTTPTADISANRLLSDGSTDATGPRGDRRQVVTLNGGIRSAYVWPALSIESQSAVVGASRDELALRFAQRGADAPNVDLSTYQIAFKLPKVRVDMGQLSLGANRHVISNFSSRGIAITTGPRWAQFTVGSVAGAQLVGWDNFLGVSERDHRLNSVAATFELRPRRPGALQVRVTALDGSLLPKPAFTQGAVVDAEESRGSGVELTAASPTQRARVSMGLSQSAFVNPLRDAALTGGLAIAPMRRERKGAQYVEASLGVLEGWKLFKRIPTRLTVAVRHERIDPLYRSVGAFVQADRQQDAVDLNGAFGTVSWQTAISRGRDNLASVQSVLTSHTSGITAGAAFDAVAIKRLARIRSALPQLNVNYQFLHQFAHRAPTSNDFRPQDLADQATRSIDATGTWRARAWQVSVRDNHTRQDNRQSEREASDFGGAVQNVSVGRSVNSKLDATLDGGIEQQRNVERAEVTRIRRIGTTANWRPFLVTSLTANVTAAVTRAPPATTDVVNLETRMELSHRQVLFGRGVNARTAQLFLRFARTSASAVPFQQLVDGTFSTDRTTRMQWSLNSGLSLKAW